MAIQMNAPATIRFRFRQWDEDGVDVGPMNLGNPEYQPLVVKVQKPGGEAEELEGADITITDAGNGEAEWEAPANYLDKNGTWRAQAFLGDWPSRLVAFPVLGPNL